MTGMTEATIVSSQKMTCFDFLLNFFDSIKLTQINNTDKPTPISSLHVPTY